MTFPNILSMLRLALVPLFFIFLYYYFAGQEFMIWLARILLLVIVISDFLDGYLARRWGETSSLGSILDPLADKLFVTASFVLLAVYGEIDAWLTIIVVSKDILVSIGWCLMVLLYDKKEVKPSIFGKSATALQFLLVCVIILLPKDIPILWLEWFTAIVTILALFNYGYRGLQFSAARMNGSTKETGSSKT